MIRNSMFAIVVVLGATVASSDTAMTEQTKTAPELSWTYVADNVMGGVSEGKSSFGSEDG